MSAICLNLFEEKRQTERKTSWLTKCKSGKTPAFFIFSLYIWIFGWPKLLGKFPQLTRVNPSALNNYAFIFSSYHFTFQLQPAQHVCVCVFVHVTSFNEQTAGLFMPLCVVCLSFWYMRDLVDVNGGPKIIHFTLCLFSLLPSAHELWSEEGPRMHTDKHAQQFTQTAEWVMECVCLCVCARF